MNPASLPGYGLWCRMSNPNQPDDDASVSGVAASNPPPNVPNPDTLRLGVQTRHQSAANAMANAAAAAAPAAPAASQGLQSMTATIDYHSLVTAMSRMNNDSASNLEKGTQPKWGFKHEAFIDWQHKVGIWADSHDIPHLLEHPPVAAPAQLHKHQIAKRIVLPKHDRAYIRGFQTLHEIWSKLLAKYVPSIDAEARKLRSEFSALRQAGRPMVEHVNGCMTAQNQLTAFSYTVPGE